MIASDTEVQDADSLHIFSRSYRCARHDVGIRHKLPPINRDPYFGSLAELRKTPMLPAEAWQHGRRSLVLVPQEPKPTRRSPDGWRWQSTSRTEATKDWLS